MEKPKFRLTKEGYFYIVKFGIADFIYGPYKSLDRAYTENISGSIPWWKFWL